MDPFVTLGNWRTVPASCQSFHNVDKLVPVSRIRGAAHASTFTTQRQRIDGIAFEDHQGRARRLPEVLAATATRGLVVLKAGRLVAEQYFQGYDGNVPHILFSVSKSLTAATAGVLADQGRLDVERLVVEYVPEVVNSAYGDCTVRHLLDMTVRCVFSEEYLDASGDYIRYRRATLWDPALPGENPGTLNRLLSSLPREPGNHGEVFRYLSPNSDLLGWVVERAAGRRFGSLFSELVWQPMGAEADAYITVDAEGSPRTAGGICGLPRDLARLGEMMRLEGNHVIPAWWVEDIRSGGSSAPWKKGDMLHLFPQGRYRSNWYQSGSDSGAFCAIGIHGQWLWIDPQREVVIVKVSAQKEPVHDDTDLLLIRAFEAVSRAVGMV